MKSLRMDYDVYMQLVDQHIQTLDNVDGLPISDEELMFLTAYFKDQGLTEELTEYSVILDGDLQCFPETPWLIKKGFGRSLIEDNLADLADLLDLNGQIVRIETKTGVIEGLIEEVQFNRYVGQIFVTIINNSETLQFVFSQVPEYEIVTNTKVTKASKVVTPLVKQNCELVLPFNERKPFDDHFRIFTLFSALEYEVVRDKQSACYRISLKYTDCECALVQQILLQVCKKVQISTPIWAEWLDAELAAITEMY